MSAWLGRTGRMLGVSPVVALRALMFFVLMGGHFIIRPVRDAIGIAVAVRLLENLIFVTVGVVPASVPLASARRA